MEYKVTDEQINEYISGELTGNDLVEFKKLLANDKELQQQIKVHQQIDEVLSENYVEANQFNEAVYKSEKERLNPIFQKMNKQYFIEEDTNTVKKTNEKEIETTKDEKSTPIIRRLLPLVTLAAAAALLLFLFNPFANNFSPPQLADQYFELHNPNSYRGEFDKDDSQKTPRELLAQGTQQYQNNQIEQAMLSFQQVADNHSLVYQNEANWYLALCYLKQNQPEKAKPLFIKLKATKNYSENAKDILKQLD